MAGLGGAGTAGQIAAAAGAQAGKNSNRSAAKARGKAEAGEDAILERGMKLYDTFLSKVQDAENRGMFDPEKRIAAFKDTVTKDRTQASEALGGGLRIAGYKPGDSEIGTRLSGLNNQFDKYVADQSETIRQNTLNNQLTAYSGAPTGLLGIGAQIYGGRYGRNQGQNPAGFYGSIMPFLGRGK